MEWKALESLKKALGHIEKTCQAHTHTHALTNIETTVNKLFKNYPNTNKDKYRFKIIRNLPANDHHSHTEGERESKAALDS